MIRARARGHTDSGSHRGARRCREGQLKSASALTGVLRYQRDDGWLTHGLNKAFGHTEVHLANDTGVCDRDLGKRASAQNEPAPLLAIRPFGPKAVRSQVLAHRIKNVAGGQPPPAPATCPPAHLLWVITGPNGFGEHGGEQCVGTVGSPAAADLGVEPVDKARSPRSGARLRLFKDERRLLEHPEVLADGVVVKPQQLGELGDADRSSALGEVAKDPMACRIPERTGRQLQRVGI